MVRQIYAQAVVFLKGDLVLFVGLFGGLFSEVQHYIHVSPLNFPLFFSDLDFLILVLEEFDVILKFGESFSGSHDLFAGLVEVLSLPVGFVFVIGELFAEIQNDFLVLRNAIDNLKVLFGLGSELFCFFNQFVVDLLVLVAKFAVQSVDFVDFCLELQPEGDFFAEGLLSCIVFIHQDCLFVTQTEVLLPQLLYLLKYLTVLLLI